MASLRKIIAGTLRKGRTKMDASTHPYRSVLYIPGSKERALEKARTLPCDAIIFDLEDAVAPDAKAEARETAGGRPCATAAMANGPRSSGSTR